MRAAPATAQASLPRQLESWPADFEKLSLNEQLNWLFLVFYEGQVERDRQRASHCLETRGFRCAFDAHLNDFMGTRLCTPPRASQTLTSAALLYSLQRMWSALE